MATGAGPIEFINATNHEPTPPGSHSGGHGLIQPPPHGMTNSEAHASLVRAGMFGDELDDGLVVDPHTGRVVPPELNKPLAAPCWR